MKFSSAYFRLFFTPTFFILFLYQSITFSQSSDLLDLDTVKAGKFDTGKMWTFEYPPTHYFKETYWFTPDNEWFKHVQLPTLKFGNRFIGQTGSKMPLQFRQ